MKIWQFVGSLDDGGAETLVKDYSILLKDKGHDVTIITIIDVNTSSNFKQVIQAGIRVIPIFKSCLLDKIRRRIFEKRLVVEKIKSLIAIENPQCIHIHLPLLKFLEPLGKELEGVKLVYTCHSVPKRYFTGKEEAEYFAAKKLIRNNNMQMIALHKEMASEISEIFKIKNVLVINNGPIFKKFLDVSITKFEKKRTLGIPDNSYVVGHIGRFHPIKNHLFLIDVFSEIYKFNHNAFLLLVGHGDLKNKIVKKLNDLGLDGHYLILSHRADIHEILKVIDVMVFPSLLEGLSVTLVEAQVSGVRCIISDTISNENVLSQNTIALPLSENPSKWANLALDITVKNHNYGNIEEYNLSKVINILEHIYSH